MKASSVEVQDVDQQEAPSLLTLQDDDSRVVELLTKIPVLPEFSALCCSVVNVLLPGIGTIFATLITTRECNYSTQLVIGLLQLLTCIYIVGWLWSIYWGYLMIQAAEPDEFVDQPKKKKNHELQTILEVESTNSQAHSSRATNKFPSIAISAASSQPSKASSRAGAGLTSMATSREGDYKQEVAWQSDDAPNTVDYLSVNKLHQPKEPVQPSPTN